MPTRSAPPAVDQRASTGHDPAASPDGFSRTGGVVYRALRAALRQESGSPFLVRRARNEVERARRGSSAEVRHLLPPVTALEKFLEGGGAAGAGARLDLSDTLLGWAGHLECFDRMAGASSLLDAALELRPADPELTLHSARVARKDGQSERARSLYRRVRDLDTDEGRLARMARVGLALLHDDPERALGRALREAIRAGDREAAAVAHEERAALRRAARDRAGALRDYAGAAVRFEDPGDRGRVIHAAADLLMAAGDVLAAREVLLEMEHLGRPTQERHARARLRSISRTLGDELGLRRWKDESGGRLVFLSSPRHRSPEGSFRSMVARGLRRISAI